MPYGPIGENPGWGTLFNYGLHSEKVKNIKDTYTTKIEGHHEYVRNADSNTAAFAIGRFVRLLSTPLRVPISWAMRHMPSLNRPNRPVDIDTDSVGPRTLGTKSKSSSSPDLSSSSESIASAPTPVSLRLGEIRTDGEIPVVRVPNQPKGSLEEVKNALRDNLRAVCPYGASDVDRFEQELGYVAAHLQTDTFDQNRLAWRYEAEFQEGDKVEKDGSPPQFKIWFGDESVEMERIDTYLIVSSDGSEVKASMAVTSQYVGNEEEGGNVKILSKTKMSGSPDHPTHVPEGTITVDAATFNAEMKARADRAKATIRSEKGVPAPEAITLVRKEQPRRPRKPIDLGAVRPPSPPPPQTPPDTGQGQVPPVRPDSPRPPRSS